MTLEPRNDERTYRCANRPCGREETGTTIPKGWFGLRQYPGDRDLRPSNFGLYCSIKCLGETVEDIRTRATEVPA